jgi:hypothetical protein
MSEVELSAIEIGGIAGGSVLGFLLVIFLFGPEHLRLRAGNAINVILSCLGRQQIDNLSENTNAISYPKQTEKTNSVKMCGIPVFECSEVLNCIEPQDRMV